MKLIKCDKCQSTFTSQFCPDCGQNRKDIKFEKPIKYTTYLQVDDLEQGYEFCSKHGIDPKSDLGENIRGINYEVKLVYKIVGDKLELIEVDNYKVVKKD